jgi:CheY-like chemotaxis protein
VTAPVPTHRRLILVVDDEPFMLQMVARILREGGYEVVVAAHGLAAREILGHGRLSPDLVLTDLKMPHMSGVELGRAIAQLDPSVPMAYMSGFGAEAESVLSPDEVSRCYIAKPFPPEALLELVSRCIRPSAMP